MSDVLNKEIGVYIPSFFFIKIFKQFDEYNFSSILLSQDYFHEFIHFLQDTSTTFGMMNFISSISCIQSDAFIAQAANPAIKLPISTQVGTASYNDIRISFINGDNHLVYNPMFIKTDMADHWAINTQTVRIIYNGSNEYYFGVKAIHETMAYLSEQILFKNKKSLADFPYLAAMYIADDVCPGFSHNIRNLIALCDASLMCCNPPEVFYITLLYINQNKITPVSYQEVYDIVTSLFHYPCDLTLLDLYITNAIKSLSSLKCYLGSDQIFINEYSFVDSVIWNMMHIRCNRTSFILDILEADFNLTSYIEILKQINLPITYNIDDEGFVDNRYPETNNTDFGLYRTMYELYVFFHHGVSDNTLPVRYECGLLKHCQSSSNKTYVDCRCCNAPWQRAQDKVLCPFAKIWHRWGLTNKKLEYL